MLKKFAIFAAVVAVVTMVALSFITARYIDKEEILRVENEKQELVNEKAKILTQVADLTAEQDRLNASIDEMTGEITRNKQKIEKLEEERADNQLKIRGLRTKDELEKKFADTYPGVVDARFFGITQFHDPVDDVSLPYYVIPAWFVGNFIEEHMNAATYFLEIEEFKANEQLYGSIIDLKDRVVLLEAEKSTAWREGYDNAYEKYMVLNAAYIDLLKKPPSVEFKPPSLWSSVGGLVLGVAIGAGI